jgi:hypothetical protein
MIVFLFDYYFNPLTITTIKQVRNDTLLTFASGEIILIPKAQAYDVAASINSAIEDFHKGKA